MNIVRTSIRAFLSFAVLTAPLALNTAAAGERKVTRHDDRGHAVQREALRHRDSGTITTNTTRTGANGKVSTRNSVSTVDKEAGTWSRSSTAVGPNGKTSTRVTTKTIAPAP